MRALHCRIAVVFLFAACAASASADPLGLEVDHYPLVNSTEVSVIYRFPAELNGMGLLTAVGWPVMYNESGTGEIDLYDGEFSLSVVIDPFTRTAISGEVFVSGDPDGALVDLYQSSILTAFGYDLDADKFEFKFIQEGDMDAPDGEPLAVVIEASSIVGPYDFNSPFSNNGNGLSNIWYLPEPTTAGLLGLGLASLVRRRRR